MYQPSCLGNLLQNNVHMSMPILSSATIPLQPGRCSALCLKRLCRVAHHVGANALRSTGTPDAYATLPCLTQLLPSCTSARPPQQPTAGAASAHTATTDPSCSAAEQVEEPAAPSLPLLQQKRAPGAPEFCLCCLQKEMKRRLCIVRVSEGRRALAPVGPVRLQLERTR
jgi:hypothetical protein